jgi:hypothetical protein
MKKKIKYDNNKIILYAAITVLVLIIFLSGIKVPTNGMVTYTEKRPVIETKNVAIKEPYQTEKCYETNTSYNIKWDNIERQCLEQKCIKNSQICLAMNEFGNCIKWSDICESYKCQKYQLNCRLEIINKDGEPTQVNLDSYVINKNEAKNFIKRVITNLTPNKPQIILWQYNHSYDNIYNCWYTNLSVQNITKCDKITKIKTIYKKQNITTINEVEKTVEIKGHSSLLNILLS